MWKITARSQSHNSGMHWKGTAGHGPDMGQGAALQCECALATQGPHWQLLIAIAHPGKSRRE